MTKVEYLFILLILILALNVIFPAELNLYVLLFSVYAIFLINIYQKVESIYINKKLEFSVVRALIYFLIIAFFVIASIDGIYFSRSRDHLILLIGYLLLVNFLYTIILRERKIWLALGLLNIVAAFIALYAIGQYFTDFYGLIKSVGALEGLSVEQKEFILARLASKRVYGFFPFPTTLSAYLAMMLPVSLGLLIKQKNIIKKIILSIMTTVQLAALYLTKSFGGLVTIVGVVMILLIFLPVKYKKINWKVLIIPLTILLILAVLIIAVSHMRGGLLKLDDPFNPVTLRIANWKIALQIALNYPFLGVGPGNYATAFPAYYLPNTQASQYAHNSYLQLLCEIGIIPTLILISLLISWLYKILRTGYNEKKSITDSYNLLYIILLASVLGFLINNIFEINVYYASLGLNGILLCTLLSKVTFQKEDSPEERIFIPLKNNNVPNSKVREKKIVAILIFLWLFMTVFLGQRFVSQIFYESSQDFYKTNKYDSSESDLTIASLVDPFDSNYPYLQSLIEYKRFQMFQEKSFLVDAIESATLAVKLNPRTPYLRQSLSHLLLKNGNVWQSLYQLQYTDYLIPYIKKYRDEVDLFHRTLINKKTEK